MRLMEKSTSFTPVSFEILFFKKMHECIQVRVGGNYFAKRRG